MIGWDTDVLELPIRVSATGDILCLSKAATKGRKFYLSIYYKNYRCTRVNVNEMESIKKVFPLGKVILKFKFDVVCVITKFKIFNYNSVNGSNEGKVVQSSHDSRRIDADTPWITDCLRNLREVIVSPDK